MNDIYDVVVIGGGPAGLTAALYAGRNGYNILLIEKIGLGGQIMLTDIIENYPGFPAGITGFELQDRLSKQIDKFGAKKIFENVVKIEKNASAITVITEHKFYYAHSIVIASGANHRKLNIPGENEFISRGVSYCGTCDGPLFKNRDIIVVGGGDTAVSEAIFLSKFAKNVFIVHRREKFRAVKNLVDRAVGVANIKNLFNTCLVEIRGDQTVKGAVLKNMTTNEEYEKQIDGVFIFIGNDPNNEFVNKDMLDTDGYIIGDENLSTMIPGIYVAGDVRSGTFKQIVCAASDGARASENAGKYVDKIRGNLY